MQKDTSPKISEIILSIKHLCSRQEKCKSEVKEKLVRWELDEDKIEEIIALLIKEKFIDEDRYTGFFVRDKIKFNKWGKIKIRHHLVQKRIPENIISNAFDNIDITDYKNIIEREIEKKLTLIKKDPHKKDKLIRFMQSKGFELDLVLPIVTEKVK